MAAAGQPRADFLGDDLRRTARKSEEADQTRQLLALAVILDDDPRRWVSPRGRTNRRRGPAGDPGPGVALQGRRRGGPGDPQGARKDADPDKRTPHGADSDC